jgi:hypothetical protein
MICPCQVQGAPHVAGAGEILLVRLCGANAGVASQCGENLLLRAPLPKAHEFGTCFKQ